MLQLKNNPFADNKLPDLTFCGAAKQLHDRSCLFEDKQKLL